MSKPITHLDRIDFMNRKAREIARVANKLLDHDDPNIRMDMQSIMAEVAAINRCAEEAPQ